MIERKTIGLSDRKSEISTTSPDFLSFSKKNFLPVSRTKTEARIIQKPSKMTKNCIGDACTASKSRQKETSEGGEKFVNKVFNRTERRNSEKALNSVNKLRKNVGFTSNNDKSGQNNTSLRSPNKSIRKETDKNANDLKLTHPVSKKRERSVENKKKIVDNCANKPDQSDKSKKIKSSSPTKRSDELKQIKTQNEFSRFPGNQEQKETVSKERKNKLTDSNRKKPSEIPLRTTRLDASRKPKPVSMLPEKPIKHVESLSSVDFYSTAKPFSPVNETSVCSELRITINAISSSEKLDNTDKPINSKRPATQENIFNVGLEKFYKSLNIPIVTSLKSTEFLEEKSFAGKKTKFLDLEKVKTTSFTVLQSNSSVLNRLESLHKQNVLAKNKINAVNPKKSMPLTPKVFINSIKRRGSRKSISSRLNNIRNKSNLKLMQQKSEKEILKDVYSPEKLIQSKINTNHLNAFKELLRVRKSIPLSSEEGTRTNEVVNTKHPKEKEDSKNSSPKSVWNEEKSFLKKVRNYKNKKKSKIPTSQKLPIQKPIPGETENLEKSKSFTNSVPNKNEIESVDYSKDKTEKPVTSLSNTDQNQIKLKNRTKKQKEDGENLVKTPTEESEISSNSSKCTDQPVETKVLRGKAGRRLTKNQMVKIKSELQQETDSNLDEISEKQENLRKKVKMQLKIDLNLENTPEENIKSIESCGWLFKTDTKDPPEEICKEEKVESILPNTLLSEWAKKTENLSETNLNLRETTRDCSLLKEKFLDKMSSLKTKGIRKKIRSDAGDRPPLPSFGSFFTPDLPLQNKPKPNSDRKSSLKCFNKDENRDVLEEEGSVKLKRRNSEPISLTGYVCKKTNFSFFKGDKPSMSSMASSLRHLNTDDFDDFIFWEPVPQKRTSCWEISLYQFKKPWSVLSCSVFRDNRLSNTPGQILENLRNGGDLSTRQSARSNSERVNCAKGNSFDVEPSIAQKNIDIRNWLAALNFPTSTSNSSDVINEVNFSSQSTVDFQNLNKAQVPPKRRQALRNVKLLEKTPKVLPKDKNLKDEENIRENVREKTEECIINELLNSKNITHRPNPSQCLASKSAEEKSLLMETDNRNTASESIVFKKQEFFDDSLACSSQLDAHQPNTPKTSELERAFGGNSKFLFSRFKIGKYLFIFTIFIIILFYDFNAVIHSLIFLKPN